VTEGLLVALKVSVALLILGIGLGSTFADLLYIWRRPGLLLRSLLAMYVLVPLAAVVLVSVLPVNPAVKAALLVLAVSAGAPNGTVRSFAPLPNTRIVRRPSSTSSMSRPQSSLTRIPVA